MPRRSNFKKAVKQITTTKKLGRAVDRLTDFAEHLQTRTDPYKEDAPRKFFIPDPNDSTSLIWDPQGWFEARRTTGFSDAEIDELRSMFENYWKKAGRRRRRSPV